MQDDQDLTIDPEEKKPAHSDDVADDDIVPEESEEYSGAAAKDKLKKLKEKIAALEKERREYLDGWQRARADYANFKKEQEEAKKEVVRFANERLFEDLIPALDSFDMAFANKEAWEKADKNWRIGVEYIYSQIVKALENHGLTQFSPSAGDKFDNQKHEAIGTVPGDQSNDHTVAEPVKKGYMLKGEVFRPAQVKIFEFKREG